MPITITDPYVNNLIPNELSGFHLEQRDFEYEVKHTLQGQVISHEFSLSGAPGNLTINPQTGVITGNLLSLEDNGHNTNDVIYPEFDYRKYDDRRKKGINTFEYTLTVKVEGQDIVGTSTVSWEDEKTFKIVLSKDHTVNVLIHKKQFLDGLDSRTPFTCHPKEPSNQTQCELIGGEWKNNRCSLIVPNNQQKCEEIGGVWENNYCTIEMIDNQTQCELLGYDWIKNQVQGASTYQEFLTQNEQTLDQISISIQEDLI